MDNKWLLVNINKNDKVYRCLSKNGGFINIKNSEIGDLLIFDNFDKLISKSQEFPKELFLTHMSLKEYNYYKTPSIPFINSLKYS